jgi:hypothetical protein
MAAALQASLTHDVLSPVPILIPWARLISGLSALPAVMSLGVIAAGGSVDLWVVMADEDDTAEAEVSRLERAFRIAVGAVPFELHLAVLSMMKPANLPSFETVFSR